MSPVFSMRASSAVEKQQPGRRIVRNPPRERLTAVSTDIAHAADVALPVSGNAMAQQVAAAGAGFHAATPVGTENLSCAEQYHFPEVECVASAPQQTQTSGGLT